MRPGQPVCATGLVCRRAGLQARSVEEPQLRQRNEGSSLASQGTFKYCDDCAYHLLEQSGTLRFHRTPTVSPNSINRLVAVAEP
jgi:hypothetical protein